MIVHATGAADTDTVTQIIYGRCDGGPPQKIASIVWTIGPAIVDGATAGYLWAEHAVVTSHHATDLAVGGSAGADGVGSVSFDASGFRYIYGQFTGDTGDPVIVTCLYRIY